MAFNNGGYALVQGRVFLQERLFNGAPVGPLNFIGDADTVSLAMSQKTDDITDTFTGPGLLVGAPVVETTCDLTITALDMRLQNWAIATWGAWTGAKAAGHVSSESITLFNGGFAKLANIGVSGLSIAGAAAGTDWVYDTAAHGMVRVPLTSTAAPAGSPLSTTCSYDYAANNGRADGFVLGRKFYTVVVAGVNAAQSNQPTVLTVRQVQLGVTKKVDTLSKKHITFELVGKALYDSSLPKAAAPGDLSNVLSWELA